MTQFRTLASLAQAQELQDAMVFLPLVFTSKALRNVYSSSAADNRYVGSAKSFSEFLIWSFLPPFTDALPEGQLQLPQFTSVPSNVTAYEMTTLLCSVSGSPTPDITWLKDGVPLDTSDPRFTPSPQGLGIRGLQGSGGASLEGVYHCIASNLAGSVRSTSAVLTRTGMS